MREIQIQSLVRKIPGEDIGYPLQYSCLENSMDRGTWQAIVHGVRQSRKKLSVANTFNFTREQSYENHEYSSEVNQPEKRFTFPLDFIKKTRKRESF